MGGRKSRLLIRGDPVLCRPHAHHRPTVWPRCSSLTGNYRQGRSTSFQKIFHCDCLLPALIVDSAGCSQTYRVRTFGLQCTFSLPWRFLSTPASHPRVSSALRLSLTYLSATASPMPTPHPALHRICSRLFPNETADAEVSEPESEALGASLDTGLELRGAAAFLFVN